jgi:xylulokinase
MSYVLGLDLGTSSLKGLLVDKIGQVVAEMSAEYPLITPQPGFSEQNPQVWLDACDTVMQGLSDLVPDFRNKLEGISFSGQMHSLVLLDEHRKVLRNAILWNDVRTTKQCQEIMSEFGEQVLSITKNVALEGFTLPKILWIQEHEPDIWSKARYVQLPKDYLRMYLTDDFHMDYSDAAGTLMLDVEQKQWSQEIIDKFGIDLEILPELVEASGYIGDVSDIMKSKYGFTTDVKVFAGGADNACAAVGAGIVKQGSGMCSIGTSGVFLAYEDSLAKSYDGKLHLFNHAAPGATYAMGVTLAAGNSLNWFRDTFAPGQGFAELLEDISTIAPGSDGLLFTPYIVGERTPYPDANIRGSFIGIDTHHNLTHFGRAVLEGITFSLKDSQTIMEELAPDSFDKIVSVGGGAKNPDWLQMQADIFNAEIVTLTTEQGPGLGAAILAAYGVGWFKDIQAAIDVFVSYKDPYQPIPENVRAYQKAYAKYHKIYDATKAVIES